MEIGMCGWNAEKNEKIIYSVLFDKCNIKNYQ